MTEKQVLEPTGLIFFAVNVNETKSKTDFAGNINDYTKVAPRQWNIDLVEGNPGPTRLYFTDGSQTTLTGKFVVGHYKSTNIWEELVPSSAGSYNWDLVTNNFSPFGVGLEGGFVGSAPLPINLISFSGKATEKGNELSWKTANEKNFSHFEIEKSPLASPLNSGGGISAQKFEKIGEVKGGNAESYEYLDASTSLSNQNSTPSNQNSSLIPYNSSLFYRLKMIDLDGTFSYSKIIFIENKSENLEVGNFYPNPSQGKASVEITTNESGNWRITTFDLTGKVIHTETKFLQKGLNKISIEKLKQGVNFVQLESGRTNYLRKIINE